MSRIRPAARLLAIAALAALSAVGLPPAMAQANPFTQTAQAAQAAQAAPTREITRTAGEVYRFRNNNHYSVFAVTPQGIIATDPIDADAAAWLKNEFKTRFNQTARYLIYSHDHRDHIAGGQVFADTATVIAHARAKEVIEGEKRPTAVPQVTFTDRLEIELGGTTVELIHVGKNHSDNSIVMRFPRERVLFAVDFIPVNSLPFRDLPDAYLDEWVESLKAVERLDFDILAPGHGPLGNPQHVRVFRAYMEELRAEVLAMARAGKSLDEMKQQIRLQKYEGWNAYKDFLALNIEGMHRLVQGTRRGN